MTSTQNDFQFATKRVSNRSRLAMLLLSIFVGVFGIHRMYAGKIISGVFQMLITLTGFGVIITSIWVLFDFIFIVIGSFRDSTGAYITEWSK